jgi:hypothetical protein
MNTNGRPNYAKNYDGWLLSKGFVIVSIGTTILDKDPTDICIRGDIAVFDSFPGVFPGHIQEYTGTQWVSERFQNCFSPNSCYKINYIILRWEDCP